MRFVQIGYVVVLGLLPALACGSEDGADESGLEEEDEGEFRIFPPMIHGGFDGTNVYEAPIVALGAAGEVQWKIDDPGLARLTPSGDGDELMLMSLKAGSGRITATNAGRSVSAAIIFNTYTPEDYKAGQARYGMGPDADNPGCMECHGRGKGPDHTPTEVVQFADDKIQNTFLTGIDLEGRPLAEETEYASLLKGKEHKWKVTDAEKIGLVAYLRALPPMGFPADDESD
jgi:hypothetical protein